MVFTINRNIFCNITNIFYNAITDDNILSTIESGVNYAKNLMGYELISTRSNVLYYRYKRVGDFVVYSDDYLEIIKKYYSLYKIGKKNINYSTWQKMRPLEKIRVLVYHFNQVLHDETYYDYIKLFCKFLTYYHTKIIKLSIGSNMVDLINSFLFYLILEHGLPEALFTYYTYNPILCNVMVHPYINVDSIVFKNTNWSIYDTCPYFHVQYRNMRPLIENMIHGEGEFTSITLPQLHTLDKTITPALSIDIDIFVSSIRHQINSNVVLVI
jgi:hypothetical protein